MVYRLIKRAGYTWLKAPAPPKGAIIRAFERVQLPTAEEYLTRYAFKFKWAHAVLEYGRRYTLRPLERGPYYGMERGRCFLNSYFMALQGRDLNVRVGYAEGLATYPYSPMLHAWNTDGSSALDFTWRVRKAASVWKKIDPTTLYDYFGVEFDIDFVLFMAKRGAHRKQPSVLHNAGTTAWPEVTSYLRSQASQPRIRL